MSYDAVVPPELRSWFSIVLSWFGVGPAASESSVRSLESHIQLLRDQNTQLHGRITKLDADIKTITASRQNPIVKSSKISDLNLEKKSVKETIKSNVGHIGCALDAIRNQNDKTHLRAINANIQQLIASQPTVSIAQTRAIHSRVRAENTQLREVVQRSEDYETNDEVEFSDFEDEDEDETEPVITPTMRSQILTE